MARDDLELAAIGLLFLASIALAVVLALTLVPRYPPASPVEVSSVHVTPAAHMGHTTTLESR
jgi:hypothetical protein